MDIDYSGRPLSPGARVLGAGWQCRMVRGRRGESLRTFDTCQLMVPGSVSMSSRGPAPAPWCAEEAVAVVLSLCCLAGALLVLVGCLLLHRQRLHDW